MCGISGYVGIDDPELLHRMNKAVEHRGPDGRGLFREGAVGLGHRRLSIIDLEGGHQPLYNEDESLVLVCNGEIYNYRQLRDELIGKGHVFQTESDSEVILHLWEDRGPEALDALNGMFAFALHDRNAHRLYLARDRIGIKPLYYLVQDEALVFASELKAVLQWREYSPRLDPDALDAYLSLRYVPGPTTLLRGIDKFPAGHWGAFAEGTLKLHRYWAPQLPRDHETRSPEEWLDAFGAKFEESVRRRMIADVPVGAYLSGGIDSSVVCAAMSRLTDEPVRTFSVGFDFDHDEAAQARETAERLGCSHSELRYGPEDLRLLPDIVRHLDEPVGDPIVIPMYRLSEAARKDVKVVLTGEGADETLGGYFFQKALLKARRLSDPLPRWLLRSFGVAALRATPSTLLDRAFDYPAKLGQRGKEKVVELMRLLARGDTNLTFRHLLSLFDPREKELLYTHLVTNHLSPSAQIAEPDLDQPSDAALLDRLIHWHFAHWLPDDILMKQDKLSMAHGLEARVPFLDHELVELALQVPPELKIAQGTQKLLLRRHTERVLPGALATRKKVPFYVPFENDLQDPFFREMLEDTLSERTLARRGFFVPREVTALKDRLVSGEFLYAKQVFSLMTFELWCRAFIDR